MTQANAAAPATTAVASRPRIFYGWWIVLGAIVALFVSAGSQGSVSGVFLRPMSEDLGWTRAQFTIATSLGTGVSGLIGFFIGGYVDRVGARPLMVVGVTIVGGTLLAISRVEELWQFIVLRGLIFTIGFVLIGNLVVNVTVSKWFVERRGWAISMASLGFSAASITMPLVMIPVVDTLGWRDGWVVMGVASWVLVYPVALIMRRQPEDYGLLPDGKIEGDPADARAVEIARREYANSRTRGEAVRTFAMWLLVLAFGFAMVGLISLIFHSIPFLTDNGYTRREAALIVAAQGGSAVVSKFAWGWAMQHFPARGLAAISFLMSGGAVLVMVPIAATGSLELMFAAFVVWGWGIGGMIPLSEFIWAQFFGRRHLGAVRSAGMPVMIIFSASGPFFAGAYYDALGSYDGALITFASLWFVAAGLIMLARQPKPKVAAPSAPAPGETPAAAMQAAASIEDGAAGPAERAAEPVAAVPARSAAGAPADPVARAASLRLPPPPSPAKTPITNAEPAPDAPPPEPLEVTAMEDAGQQTAGIAEAVPRRPSTQRPRDYMSDDDGSQPLRDYMRQQLDVPRETPTNGSAPASQPEPEPEPQPASELEPAPQPESRPGASVADTEAAEAAGPAEPVAEPSRDDVADEGAPMPEQPQPPEPSPAPGRGGYGPPSWQPAQPALPDGGPGAERSVNLGEATRAIQRRLPNALTYYRRDGVATAVWAGVATSVAVTAAVWLLTRNSK
ncbi:MAG: MFS transporter [Dehalococcoidia bacterium]